MSDLTLIFVSSEVHQAEGALVAQLRICAEEAAEVLRARACEKGVSVEQMAAQVLDALAHPRRDGRRTAR